MATQKIDFNLRWISTIAIGMALNCSLAIPVFAQRNSLVGKNIPLSWSGKSAHIFVTAQGTGQRISPGNNLAFEAQPHPKETDVCVFVDPIRQFQKMIGFGGALTDASAETFARLPHAVQNQIINAYYDPDKGIGYTFGRTNINSCDFSSDSYTYVQDNDTSLKTFSIAHDERYKIPLIKKVNEKLNGQLTLFASPWTPPAWMKDNDNMLQGGHLKPEFYKTWAEYFVKFIEAYKKQGIPIWGVTVQNEPMAVQRWESCVFTADEERDFIKNALGPVMRENNLGHTRIIAWDHNRDLINQYAGTILNDPDAAKYVWGIGFHWYETWTKSAPMYDNVKLLRQSFPHTNLLFTEGSKERFDFNNINDWSFGELYADNILNDLNNGIRAWCDWNILLDQTGGPNHVGNFCYAPLIGDTNTGKLYFTNEYWYIGQFSKFIRPGARRVSCSSNRDALQTTGFINQDGKLAVVVLNKTDRDIDYHLWIGGQWAAADSKAHSIETIIL